jgi:hypothetical protein
LETIYRNYIADNTRMPVPSAYFLQRLYDFDSYLVILPSRVRAGAYVIGRRKQFSRGITEKAIDEQYSNPDTKMCVLNNCVPVCMMFATGATWDPDYIIAKLKARDIWAHGGADKVADMLEAQEAAEAAALKKSIRDDLWNRSGDGWRTYQARTGQSTIRHNDLRPTKPKESPSHGEVAAPSKTAGARSTAGLARRSKKPRTIGRRGTKGNK